MEKRERVEKAPIWSPFNGCTFFWTEYKKIGVFTVAEKKEKFYCVVFYNVMWKQ